MEKLNLYQKIQAVSNEVKNIEKNMQVGQGSYAYKAVSDLDVVLAVKKAETKFGLTSVPTTQELISSEVLRKKTYDEKRSTESETITFVDVVKLTLRIIDLDDLTSYIDVEALGRGVDASDKGFGKAATYARKYALLNAYKIPTGTDPDNDPSKKLEVDKKPDDIKNAVSSFCLKDAKYMANVLSNFSVGSFDDLTDSQIKTIYETLKTKKLI